MDGIKKALFTTYSKQWPLDQTPQTVSVWLINEHITVLGILEKQL